MVGAGGQIESDSNEDKEKAAGGAGGGAVWRRREDHQRKQCTTQWLLCQEKKSLYADAPNWHLHGISPNCHHHLPLSPVRAEHHDRSRHEWMRAWARMAAWQGLDCHPEVTQPSDAFVFLSHQEKTKQPASKSE